MAELDTKARDKLSKRQFAYVDSKGGEHLPMITLVGAALARAIQDFVHDGTRRDTMLSRSGILAVATIRMVPIAPFTLVNLAA